MIINLSPIRSDVELSIFKSGDRLIINGEVFDFSVIPDDATLPATAVSGGYFTGDINRAGGVLSLTMIAPHGANPSNAAAFPSPLINPADGVLELPQ
jgi:hypothetical protein